MLVAEPSRGYRLYQQVNRQRMRLWLLLSLFLASSHATAGLFADEDARKQIQQQDGRIAKLEKALASSEAEKERLIRSILDLQIQMESLNAELRKFRGQNEEFTHRLEDAEKRQKDYYVDLDTRLRRIESGSPTSGGTAEGAKSASAQPAGEKQVLEAAYALYQTENYQRATAAFRDFLKSYPQSAYEANVYYWLGNSYFLLKDCRSSVSSYQTLIDKYQDHPRVPEAMLNIADCQLELKNKAAAKKTLKQIISQFPGSDASEKAKKRIAFIK